MEAFLCRSLVVFTYFFIKYAKWNLGEDMWGAWEVWNLKRTSLYWAFPYIKILQQIS
jgi:hypothetical protein